MRAATSAGAHHESFDRLSDPGLSRGTAARRVSCAPSTTTPVRLALATTVRLRGRRGGSESSVVVARQLASHSYATRSLACPPVEYMNKALCSAVDAPRAHREGAGELGARATDVARPSGLGGVELHGGVHFPAVIIGRFGQGTAQACTWDNLGVRQAASTHAAPRRDRREGKLPPQNAPTVVEARSFWKVPGSWEGPWDARRLSTASEAVGSTSSAGEERRTLRRARLARARSTPRQHQQHQRRSASASRPRAAFCINAQQKKASFCQ